MPVNPWITFSLDLLAAPAAAWLWRVPRPRPARFPVLRLAGVGVCVLWLGVPSFCKMALNAAQKQQDRQLVALDPREWVGRPWAGRRED